MLRARGLPLTLGVLSGCLSLACAGREPLRAPTASPDLVEAEASAPSPEDRRIELAARWEALARSKYALASESPELAALIAAGPALPRARWDLSLLESLLPPPGISVGDTWPVDGRNLLPLLTQFHPGATLSLHHGFVSREGAVATLLDDGNGRSDILLRLHAEIEAVPGVLWYTPAQFEGRLVWDRANARPLHFELGVPPRDTNVDVNARVGEEIHADIGFAPVMRLELVGEASAPERDLAPARRALARAIYGGFAEIDWMPLAEALPRARTQGRPLHVLILFGTLDDESC